jgi:hypothetical protein
MLSRTWRLAGSGATLLLAASVAAGCDSDDDSEAEAGASGLGGSSAGSGGKTGGGGTKTTGGSGVGASTGAGTGGTHAAAGGRGGTDPGGGGTEQGGTSASGGQPNAHEPAVELGSAENYVILAKSGITTVPPSAVTGDVGVSPAAATYITGFSLTADATNAFATSPQVTGKVYAADYAAPTPSEMTTAVSDMELAFTDAAGRAADVTELGAGDIGGMTLTPGVYQWGTGLLIPTDVTLAGDSEAVWIFQIAQDLTVSSATRVRLSGGASADHVFWQVSGQVSLGTTSHFEGIVLTATAITLETGASLNGRLLAQTAVSLDSNAVVEPAP